MPIAEPYRESADRWGSDAFHQYCQLLERQADAALQHASKVQLAMLHGAHIACLELAQMRTASQRTDCLCSMFGLLVCL